MVQKQCSNCGYNIAKPYCKLERSNDYKDICDQWQLANESQIANMQEIIKNLRQKNTDLEAQCVEYRGILEDARDKLVSMSNLPGKITTLQNGTEILIITDNSKGIEVIDKALSRCRK